MKTSKFSLVFILSLFALGPSVLHAANAGSSTQQQGSANEGSLEKLHSNEAKQLPIFSTIYQCIYPGQNPDSRAWNSGEFTIKQSKDYTIVIAKFPERNYGVVTPSPIAVGMMSKATFILAVVTPSFDCPIGKKHETVPRKKEIDRWFSLDGEIVRDRLEYGSLYDEFRAKFFPPTALEDFDRTVNSL